MASGFDDFLTGLAANNPLKPLVDEQQARNKQKLELAMLSRKLELEQQAKQIPTNQAMASFGALGARPEQVSQFGQFQSINPDVFTQTATGIRQVQAATNKPQRPVIRHVNVNGDIVREVSSPLTGEVTSRETLGINPGRAKAASDALAAYNASAAILDRVREQLPRVLPAQNLPQLIAQYGNIKINQFTQTNPEQKAFIDFLSSAVVPLNRALGDNRISDIDRANLRDALPKETDTFATAIQKLDNFDALFEATKEGALKAYTKPLSENSKEEKKKPLSGVNKTKPSKAAQDYVKSLNIQ